MPIYEYRCEKCGKTNEFFQKPSDPPMMTCPECGADSLKKLISSTSFQLKGSGWYATDYKSKPKEENKTEDKSSSKEETKPKDSSDKSE